MKRVGATIFPIDFYDYHLFVNKKKRRKLVTGVGKIPPNKLFATSRMDEKVFYKIKPFTSFNE